MRIPCPVCGPRAASEFAYEGDATASRPPLEADAEAWFAAVYQRQNPRGPHAELWHHVSGCRSVVRVERDTATHAILSATLVSPYEATE